MILAQKQPGCSLSTWQRLRLWRLLPRIWIPCLGTDLPTLRSPGSPPCAANVAASAVSPSRAHSSSGSSILRPSLGCGRMTFPIMNQRRSTLSHHHQPPLHHHHPPSQQPSAIPLPASAVKPSHNQHLIRERLSLVPQRLAAHSKIHSNLNFQSSQHSDLQSTASQPSAIPSSQNHDAQRPRLSIFQPPLSVHRQSMAAHQPTNSNRISMSAIRNSHHQINSDFISSNFHSTPSHHQPPLNLIQSTNHNNIAHLNLLPLIQPLQTFKDPRPRDKKSLHHWQIETFEFLQERGYQEPLSLKTLQTPTTKDFQNIFKFIIKCSDQAHRWNLLGKKLEDEIIPLLKNMGYIAVDTLTKSGIQAPGSMQNWPAMLAMLHWIVMTIKLREEAMSNYKIKLDTNLEPSMDDPRSEELAAISHWFSYVGQTYTLFLQSDDFDREFHKPPLEDFFQKRKDRVLAEIERLESRTAILQSEHAKLVSKPSSFEAAKKEHEKLGRDAERFLEYIGKLRESNKKSEKQNEALKKSLESTEAKLKEASKQKAELVAKVDKQNISDVELQQISSTRSQLERSSAAAATKHLQLTESMMDLEIRTQQASDRVEKILTSWKNKAVKLGLIPRAPEPFEHVDFSQNVNGGASEVANMLPDPTVDIKPALIQLKKNAVEHRLGLTDQVLSIEEKFANLTDTLQEKKETLQTLESSVQEFAKQLEDEKEKWAMELNMLNEQVETILRRSNEIESTMENDKMSIRHEVQAYKVRLDETQEKIAKMTKDNVDEMNSTLSFILNFKERVKEKTLQLKTLSESTNLSNNNHNSFSES
ncbi:hypothetical protein O181_037985 [Austropuccinia psidii MF-1]|uniref:Kinetochore protein NDC80 homolog n=1 Tax=Austropuccinia psidii MF-1 TaxID=1389203 RepID=A0A9Q3D938_9BASI|nr:hypothetical protein [Austropuccinia psidii MF-1]